MVNWITHVYIPSDHVLLCWRYLPPYTCFYPWKDEEKLRDLEEKEKQEQSGKSYRQLLPECLLLSQLSYLAIFIILVCITERQKIREDPPNFNLLTVTLEVISGNVGFNCYSCKQHLKPENGCQDTWAGFLGRWSTKGKCILILVMLFVRLKKYSLGAGKAWHLS